MKSIANYKRINHSNYTTTMTTINQGHYCYTPKARRTLNDNNKNMLFRFTTCSPFFLLLFTLHCLFFFLFHLLC